MRVSLKIIGVRSLAFLAVHASPVRMAGDDVRLAAARVSADVTCVGHLRCFAQ